MPDETVATSIRLPGALHSALVEASIRNVRSLNGEIVARLQASTLGAGGGDAAPAPAPSVERSGEDVRTDFK